MPQLNTSNETKDISDALDYAREVVKALASEKTIALSDEQIDTYVALIVSNNFQDCANTLWRETITKIFLGDEDDLDDNEENESDDLYEDEEN